MGKTALLDRIAVHADGAAVLQVRGVEAEHALAFASLHQLLRPVLPLAADLPEPQRKALEHALAVSPGPAADRLAIGAATLGLLAAAAAELPVVCLLDDANWLDEASAEALVFAARRLGPERVAVVFALRPSVSEFAPPGVEVLELERLGATDARELLAREAGTEVSAEVAVQDQMFALGDAIGRRFFAFV